MTPQAALVADPFTHTAGFRWTVRYHHRGRGGSDAVGPLSQQQLSGDTTPPPTPRSPPEPLADRR